jgi:NAD-dependent SIR2 family protein deacetylase
VRTADALVVGAGAGMGVDSGLPDFRGPAGFWRAYPPYAKLGLRFEELASPRWFATDPSLAWGFYGHRRNLYRRTAPHAGFAILRRWAARLRQGMFVLTSNIDGHFQRAGVPPERVVEVHGALDWLQCTRCGAPPWPAPAGEIDVDEETFRAREPWPRCACGALARPNVLMFGDWEWDGARTEEQETRFAAWIARATGRLVVVECGAGTAVPSIRRACEGLLHRGATLIRVNPREPEAPAGAIAIAAGALATLAAIDAALA